MATTDVGEERRRDFGNHVRALRRARGWSQEALGERSGLHRTYVASVERGERNVSLVAIWQLADGLGVTPVSFFGDLADANP